MRLLRSVVAKIACYLVGVLAWVTPSGGYELEWGGWVLDPTLFIREEFGINPILLFGDEEDNIASVTTVSPGLLLRRHTERWEVDLGAVFAYDIFKGVDIPNMDMMGIELRSIFHLTERSNFQLGSSFRRDTLLRRIFVGIEEDFVDQVDIEDIDIGLVNINLRRNRIRLDPSWNYQLTEQVGVQLGYGFLDMSVPEVEGAFDTQQHRLSAGGLYRLTPRSTLNLTGNATRITSERLELDNLEVLAGLEHAFSEVLTASAGAGYRTSSLDRNGQEEEASGFLANLRLRYQTELSQFSSSISRTVNPTVGGQPVQADRLILYYTRSIRPRLLFALRGDAFQTEGAVTEVTRRRYFEVKSLLSWNWTRWWALEGGPFYRRREFRNDFTEAVDGYGVFFALTYTPPSPTGIESATQRRPRF
jgi:hypothetical protein